MFASRPQPAYGLTVVVAMVAAAQAAGGLLIPGLYHENRWVTSVFRGTDWITLICVVPLLLVSVVAAARGSVRGRLVWLGVLYYVFYNNVYYLMSAFNPFFLVYAAVFVSSSSAMVAALISADMRAIGEHVCATAARRPASVVLTVIAAALAVMWVGQCGMCAATGQLPQIVRDTGGTTHMVAALDLTLIVPIYLTGAMWLWRGRPYGYVLATASSVQGALITLVLVVAAPFQAAAGVADAWAMTPLWAAMGIGFLVAASMLLAGAKSVPVSDRG